MKKTIWIVRTAVCLALLLVLQVATKSLGQFVTGSCVNLVLAMAALTGGVWSGVIVAVISPFCAYALGIGWRFRCLFRVWRLAMRFMRCCLRCWSADS